MGQLVPNFSPVAEGFNRSYRAIFACLFLGATAIEKHLGAKKNKSWLFLNSSDVAYRDQWVATWAEGTPITERVAPLSGVMKEMGPYSSYGITFQWPCPAGDLALTARQSNIRAMQHGRNELQSRLAIENRSAGHWRLVDSASHRRHAFHLFGAQSPTNEALSQPSQLSAELLVWSPDTRIGKFRAALNAPGWGSVERALLVRGNGSDSAPLPNSRARGRSETHSKTSNESFRSIF